MSTTAAAAAAATAAVAAACLLLFSHAVRNRAHAERPPLPAPMRNAIFLSARFSDGAILAQLTSLDHQVLLSAHGPLAPRLCALGPCIVSLARLLIDRQLATRAQAVAVAALFLQQPPLPSGLAWCARGVLDGMRDAAESYLARVNPPPWATGALPSEGALEIQSSATGRRYRAVEFLARGSAGVVYAADDASLVLKRIFPTQRESAENERRIAARLAGAPHCMPVVDDAEDADGALWLVLPRVAVTPGIGVDLCDFVKSGFFQTHPAQARSVVVQLLRGLDHVASRGVVLRDVKPDNVLVAVDDNGECSAWWSDFGLAVDLGDATSLCNVRAPRGPFNDDARARADTLGFWYDACKLVPRPKWAARRPPEAAYHSSAYDVYMMGIVLVSVALGVDLAHIDAAEDKAALEAALGERLPADYLRTFHLQPSLLTHAHRLVPACFARTFGEASARGFFDVAVDMLAAAPASRPSPRQALERLVA